MQDHVGPPQYCQEAEEQKKRGEPGPQPLLGFLRERQSRANRL